MEGDDAYMFTISPAISAKNENHKAKRSQILLDFILSLLSATTANIAERRNVAVTTYNDDTSLIKDWTASCDEGSENKLALKHEFTS